MESPGWPQKQAGLTVCGNRLMLGRCDHPCNWGCPRTHATGRADAGDASATSGGDGRLPRRAGLGRHHHDGRRERAGVSRGAQLHHFPSKQDLVVAAVEHLAERRRDEMRAWRRAACPRQDRAGGPRILSTHFTSPVFFAALELWVAARTDAGVPRVGRAAGAPRRPRDAHARAGAPRRRRVARRQPGPRAGHPRPAARPRPRRLAQRRQHVAAELFSTPGPPSSSENWSSTHLWNSS